LFCERCGQNFLPKQSVCTRCGDVATRHWLQLVSLITLLVAVVGNGLMAWFLLPYRVNSAHARFLIRGWIWVNTKFSLYGWVPVAAGLLAWDLFVWRASRPKVKGWVTRKLLTFTLLAGVAPFIPWWVPAGQPPKNFLTALNSHPGLPALLSWGIVLAVIILICINSETRDSLLGHGKTLSLVSLGALLILLALTIAGWWLA
jgi:hypothetical protein